MKSSKSTTVRIHPNLLSILQRIYITKNKVSYFKVQKCNFTVDNK